jgi:hypothetical protein
VLVKLTSGIYRGRLAEEKLNNDDHEKEEEKILLNELIEKG